MDEYSEEVIYLPSNSKCNFFENKTAHFITQLITPLQVNPADRIALTEIIYPTRFYNISSPFNKVVIHYKAGEDTILETKYLPPGFYQDSKEFIGALNKLIPRSMKTKFRYNEVTGKTKIAVGSHEFVRFEPKMSALLGFMDKTTFENTKSDIIREGFDFDADPSAPADIPLYAAIDVLNEGGADIEHADEALEKFESPMPLNLRLSTFALFVYCNVIKETYIGDTMAPILAIVNTDPNNQTEEAHVTVDRAQFVPLCTSYLSLIEIRITDSQGELIPFKSGNTLIKLILRRQVTR